MKGSGVRDLECGGRVRSELASVGRRHRFSVVLGLIRHASEKRAMAPPATTVSQTHCGQVITVRLSHHLSRLEEHRELWT
jgi:hypothetical protein